MSAPMLPGPHPDYQLAGPMDMDQPEAASAFPIQRLLSFLLKYWWLPLLTTLLCVGGAGGYVYQMLPTYVSKGRMWETIKMRLPEGSLFSEDVQNFLGTQTELLQSGTLHDLALAHLKLSTNVTIPIGKDGKALPVVVRVVGSSKSSVFLVQATGSQSAYTQAYLDALMNVYLEYKRNIRQVVSGGTLNSISTQVLRMETDLKLAQDSLTAFQRTNNLAILEEEGRTSGGYLAQLRTRLSDLQLENRLLPSLSSNQGPVAATGTNASPAGIESPAGSSATLPANAPSEHLVAFKELELLQMQRAKLSKYLRPKHPKIVRLDGDIERGQRLAEIYRRQTQEQLAASRQSVQVKIENLLLSIREWEAKVMESNARMAEAERLKLNVQRLQGVYDRLTMLVQNVAISRNIDQETLAILEPAGPAERSYKAELSLLGASSFGGLALGLGIIFLMMIRDDRFTSPSEVNEKLGEILVGQVPEMKLLKSSDALPLLEMDDARHAYAESFRSLRSALLFMTVESERPRVILVTSALPHEGKSTVAANLARALALGGSRVVLVDADLRRGLLHKRMGLPQEPGLAEALRAPGDLEKVIQTNCLPNLSFISCGSGVGHSGDIFLGPVFDGLLARLRQQYDHVVIDSSPVFASDDATTLAPKVDGTLFVVRSRYSRTGPVREALAQLYQRNARVLGVIFNQTDSASRSNYYYNHSEYYAPAQKT